METAMNYLPKNVKNAGLISVKPSISSEICPENNHKSAVFYRLLVGEVCP